MTLASPLIKQYQTSKNFSRKECIETLQLIHCINRCSELQVKDHKYAQQDDGMNHLMSVNVIFNFILGRTIVAPKSN